MERRPRDRRGTRLGDRRRHTKDTTEILAQLEHAIDDVHSRVIEKGIFFRSISVLGITRDLSVKSRSRTLESPTNDIELLKRVTSELLSSLVSDGQELRRAGVRVSDLSESRAQSSLAEFLG